MMSESVKATNFITLQLRGKVAVVGEVEDDLGVAEATVVDGEVATDSTESSSPVTASSQQMRLNEMKKNTLKADTTPVKFPGGRSDLHQFVMYTPVLTLACLNLHVVLTGLEILNSKFYRPVCSTSLEAVEVVPLLEMSFDQSTTQHNDGMMSPCPVLLERTESRFQGNSYVARL